MSLATQLTADAKRDVLESMQRTYPYYAWIGLTDNQGKVMVASGKLLEGADVSKRPWFGNALHKVHLTDVHEAVLLAKLLPNPTNEPKRFFDVAFPYVDQRGKTAGILGIHLSWQWAQEVEKSVFRPLAKRSKVDTLIVGKDSTVLLGPPDLVDKQIKLASFTNAQKNKNGFITEQWPDGKQYLVGYSKDVGYRSYPGFGWTVLVRQEADDAFRSVAELQNTILWGGLSAALAFALIGFWAARRITEPLRSIAHSASEIESGNGHAIRIAPGSYREIVALSGSLNSLLRKLAANSDSLREINATLEERVEKRTQELAQALRELKSSEHRERAIIDTALDAFVGMDSQGNIIDWNLQAEKIFGWPRAEVLGCSVASTIIPQGFRERHTEGMARFLQTGSSQIAGTRLQLSAIRRNGDEFPIEVTIGLVDTGTSRFFGAFIHDISDRTQIEETLAKERELLNAVLDTIDVGVAVCDREGTLSLFNRATKEFHGLPAQHLASDQWSEYCSLFHADGKTPLRTSELPLFRALSGETVQDDEMMVRARTGTVRSLLTFGRALIDAKGGKLGAVVVMKDITERKKAEQALRESQQRLATIADNMPATILYIDQDERYQFCNKTYETWFGRPAQAIYGKTIATVFHESGYAEEVYQDVKSSVREALSGERVVIEIQRVIHGQNRHLEATYIPHWNAQGEIAGFYAMIQDITERKNQELHHAHSAMHDALTGLPNRKALMERLDQALARGARHKKALAVMFLDLDKFKHINDTHGHATGDQVLIGFSERLKKCIRKTDTVSRLAGDEFVIIAEELMQGQADAMMIAQKIIAALDEPLPTGAGNIQARTSIGIAVHHEGITTSVELMNRADHAMYYAKQKKISVWCFSESDTLLQKT
jgi:diguanylate cyclase (GGDEF)-like protein/PAS domain S-box-containing protein